MGRDFWSFLLLPFHFTFHPANFLNGPGGVGVALLALAPLGLLLRGCDPFARIVMLFAFLQTVVWFVTEQEARFLIHVYIILAAFAVWGWSYVSSRTSRIGSFLADSAVALSILYGLLMIVPARADDIHAAVSSSYEQQRKEQLVRFLDSFGRLNSDPFVKKVLILEPRVPTYYLDKNYLKPVGRFGEETLPQGGDLSKILKDLGVLGITHVLDVRTAEHDFRLSNKPPDLVLIFDEADQRIYRYAPITEGR